MMKNLLFMSALISVSAFGQLNTAEMAPTLYGETQASIISHQAIEQGSDRAFWTIQLDADPLTISNGLAGCYWTGTEFWLSSWGDDSLFTANAAGVPTDTFVVAGVSGTRSITSDGTFMYLGANTGDIYKVNKTTKVLTSTITTSVANCRYVTFDPTLDSGAGGFWVGTWATDITAVSMTGATLSTIPAATHGLTAMYGLAYDNVTPSGPYLWAFDQGIGASTATLVQLSMTGTQTGLMHDTQTDLTGAPNTGLSGGIWVASGFVTGKNSIGGLSQNVSLFAYQIDDLLEVESIENSSLSIYPNPADNTLTISTNAKSIVKSAIYSASGQLMMVTNSNSKTFDVSSLNSGVYFLQVQTENGMITERFVKN